MDDVREPLAAGDPLARRRFLQTLGALAAAPLVGCATDPSGSSSTAPELARHGDSKTAPATGSNPASTALASPAATHDYGEAGRAFDALLASLARVRDGQLTEAFAITSRQDVAEGHRHLLHVLEQALLVELEAQPTHPLAQHQVSPVRKSNGDNADAIYYSTPLAPGRTYRLRSNQAGAAYSSVTVEAGGARGGYAGRIAGVLNDTQYDIAADGRFEIVLGGKPRPRNWIPLPDDVSRISTRHYFENLRSAATDPLLHVPMEIECLDPQPPPRPPNDASIAAAIRRIETYVRTRTLEAPRPDPMPAWVSTTPNVFNPPQKPGSLAYAAADAAYTMAPYAIGPDEALVVTGRFPSCRFANVTLWNRYGQSYDYMNRRVSLNRRQIQFEADGSYRIVIAHRDPGVPNWLDGEGRETGQVYWRIMLPEADVETPKAALVPLASLRR
ncbi:MAG: DUF1214 domain-containing protein [Deltaproteobacteria bacterium]|nr:DUF1214 domain-containing protein [Deltaproteobacteria bacterium]